MKRLLLLLGILGLIGCSKNDSLTGSGSGSQTNNTISGIIVNDSGNVIKDVRVNLISHNLNFITKGSRVDSSAIYTNDWGQYLFKNVPAGTYNMEARDTLSGNMALRFTIDIKSDEDLNVGEDTLKIPGTLNIYLKDKNIDSDGFVFIPATSLAQSTKANDEFVSITLPQGMYSKINFAKSETDENLIQLNSNSFSVSSTDTLYLGIYSTWNYTKEIFINTVFPNPINENLAGYPLLLRLDGTNFNFGQAQNSGNDIRFSTGKGAPLPYEIEIWDPHSELAHIWVLLDTLFANDSGQSINIHFGNLNVSSENNRTDIFPLSNNFSGVWHLNDNLSSNTSVANSSDINNPGIAMNVPTTGSGIIGGAVHLDGMDDWINLGNDNSFNGGNSLTISFWCNLDTIKTSEIVHKINEYSLEVLQNASIAAAIVNPDSSHFLESDPSLIITGTWQLLTTTFDGSTQKIYMDGNLIKTRTLTTTISPDPSNLTLGNDPMSGGGETKGWLDELRLWNEPKSIDWIKMDYETQKENSGVITIR